MSAKTDLLQQAIADAESRRAAGDFSGALTILAALLQNHPGERLVLLALARTGAAMGDRASALTMLDMALQVHPLDQEIRLERAAMLEQLGRVDDALKLLRAVVQSLPEDPVPLLRLGYFLRRQQDHEASSRFGKAGAVAFPGNAEIWVSLGIGHHNQGRSKEAEECFRLALTIEPNHPQAQFSLGTSLLARGRWLDGFAGFAWRRGLPDAAPAPADVPEARADRPGRRLLLWNDQGLGDALQFLRYVPLLIERGYDPVLLLPKELTRLATMMPGAPRVMAKGEALPPLDAQLPLMTLPFFLSAGPLAATVPYLCADRDEVSRWNERLRPLTGLKVGLVWAGAPRPGNFQMTSIDRRRSIDLAGLVPLLSIPGARFVSLQKGEQAAAQISALTPALRPVDWMAEVEDFADTAALVQALDLVISVDTSVAHLAGALGKPVWILSRYDGCWRWLRERADSPWYPSVRLFRQAAPGDWAPVVADVAASLGERIASIVLP